MKEGSPAVSVILPVYNTEKYLPRCLDSLLGQTFSDIEILAVEKRIVRRQRRYIA